MSEQPVYLPSARRPRPGRPRKAESGHVPGTLAVQGVEKARLNGSAVASEAIGPRKKAEKTWRQPLPVPRLLELDASAAYLGVSPWTIRDLEAAGTLCRVRIPLENGVELRKLLFDREDLDRLIDMWKDRQA